MPWFFVTVFLLQFWLQVTLCSVISSIYFNCGMPYSLLTYYVYLTQFCLCFTKCTLTHLLYLKHPTSFALISSATGVLTGYSHRFSWIPPILNWAAKALSSIVGVESCRRQEEDKRCPFYAASETAFSPDENCKAFQKEYGIKGRSHDPESLLPMQIRLCLYGDTGVRSIEHSLPTSSPTSTSWGVLGSTQLGGAPNWSLGE